MNNMKFKIKCPEKFIHTNHELCDTMLEHSQIVGCLKFFFWMSVVPLPLWMGVLGGDASPAAGLKS
jgi:hypothetical protein